MKERKLLDYFCRNKLMVENWRLEIEEKKEIITFYSNTSPAIAPKSDEHQYCSKTVATPRATSFTLSTRGSYKLGGDSVVYTSKSDGSAFCHCSDGERPLGFSSQTSMDSEEA